MKYILTAIYCCSFSFCFGQDSSAASQYKVLKRIIQRTVPDVDDSYKNKQSEFFIIDIKLDNQTDSIINIDFYRKEKSVHYNFIQTAIEKIKKEWKPGRLNLHRILIPTIIAFTLDDTNLVFDYPFPLGESIKNDIYITPLVFMQYFRAHTDG